MCGAVLSIYLSHDDVDGTDDGGDVGEEDVFRHFAQDGEVAEGGGAGFDAVGDGSALGFDEEA